MWCITWEDFPTLARCLLGASTDLPDSVLVETFIDSLSTHEANSFKKAFSEMKCDVESFTPAVFTGLIGILSRFGIRCNPSPRNLKEMLKQVASFEFLVKPTAAITAIYLGIPSAHSPFWNQHSVAQLLSLYRAQSVSRAKVLSLFEDAEGLDPNQQRVLGYLRQFVASMSVDDLRAFLRFVTGSTVCSINDITVAFNNLDNFARRPIAHTCHPSLELSTSYVTYPEFVSEFHAVLRDQLSWIMDSI